MRRPGSSKNLSRNGGKPVIAPSLAQQWPRPPRNSKEGWTSWRCYPKLPNGSTRNSNFLSALGVVLFALKGPGAPEMGFAYARALELWTLLGSPAELLGVPYGRLRYLLFRGELDLALGLDKDLLRLSQERNDAAGLIQGHFSIGRTLMFTGRFGSSRSHL